MYANSETRAAETIHCGDHAYEDGKLQPAYRGKGGKAEMLPYRGIYSRASGTVVVHPFNNASGKNVALSVVGGEPAGWLTFDYVVETGTTVDLADMELIPDTTARYKQY